MTGITDTEQMMINRCNFKQYLHTLCPLILCPLISVPKDTTQLSLTIVLNVVPEFRAVLTHHSALRNRHHLSQNPG